MTHAHENELAAAIDLGTNTALLLVARAAPEGRLDVVEELCETPRLGTGLAAHGVLDPAAQERALATLTRFATRVRDLRVDPSRVRAVGTACLRRASDGATFVARARERTGLPLEILPEADEARLSALAVAREGIGPEACVVDVGGGSTELACSEAAVLVSAPIGAVVLSEQFLSGDPPSSASFARLEHAVQTACTIFPADLAVARPVVAVGGSAVNAACLARGLSRFDPASAEGETLTADEVARQLRQLSVLSLAERRRLPIEVERAAILPAGLACLLGTLARIGASKFRVTSRGLRYGLVRELLERDRPSLSGFRPPRRS